MNALIIDSSQSYRLLLCRLLNDANFTTIDVDTLANAYQAIDIHHFDIICIAMKLPDGDSFEFCENIRQKKHTTHIPIFMLTSSKDIESNQRALTAGVTELFRKQDFTTFQVYLEHFIQRLSDQPNQTGRILYIEDSPSTAALISAVLTEQGYQVDHFLTGEDALSAFNYHYYDLLLTDVVLDDLSGLAIVRIVRSSPSEEKHTIPIIAISSFNDNARKLELFAAGINDYVTKPVLNEELLARIESLIKNRQLLIQLNNKQQQLERLALTDQLTDLYNRHYLMDVAPKKIKEALRHNYPLSLIVLDIDFFKSINDNHGHSVGDDVLKAIA